MKSFLIWALRLIVAVILGQTLFFKFTAHPESVALFAELNAEPVGRYFVGVAEAIAVALLLLPWAPVYGAALSVGLMSGALFSHVLVLGFGGSMLPLALMATVAWVCSAALVWMYRKQLPVIGSRFSVPEEA